MDGDELRGAGGWADQVVVAGFVQEVIHQLLLRIGQPAVPWEIIQSDLLGPCLEEPYCSCEGGVAVRSREQEPLGLWGGG